MIDLRRSPRLRIGASRTVYTACAEVGRPTVAAMDNNAAALIASAASVLPVFGGCRAACVSPQPK
jgi:hypothetical protein